MFVLQSKLGREKFAYFCVQLTKRKCLAKAFQQFIRDSFICSHLFEFSPKMNTMINGICVHLRRRNVLTDWIQVDVVIFVNHPATKFNRGHMTFTGRPEAHDESLRSLVHTFLVRMRNDRGIKERGCLN